MKDVTIKNAAELEKLDRTKPHAFEIVELKNGEIVCTDYITTTKQQERFLDNFTGDGLWVMESRQDTNVAMILSA